jgi:phosphatidate cytidylyltransferase
MGGASASSAGCFQKTSKRSDRSDAPAGRTAVSPFPAHEQAAELTPRRSPSNLRLRLMTAAIGLPLLIAVIWVGGWPFALVAAAVALLASAEFVHGWLFPSMPIVAVMPQASAFAASGMMVLGAHVDKRFILVGAGLAVLLGVLGYSHTNAFGPRKPYRVLCWCLLYIGLLLSSAVLLRDAADGRAWVFLGTLATFAVDTGAYTVGKLIGRHKMAPIISPGKTWEGAAGGFVAGVAAVLVLNALFDTGESALTILPIAVALPIAGQSGDLFESWMKRRMGVKDASGLLPGHGGFLDRLDSLLFVLPVLYLFLRLRVL